MLFLFLEATKTLYFFVKNKKDIKESIKAKNCILLIFLFKHKMNIL